GGVSGPPTCRGTAAPGRGRRSEARILEAARSLFAEVGYERATIRAVAGAAGVDPALVMQYFGGKQELFQRAVQVTPGHASDAGPGGADVRDVPEEEITRLLRPSLRAHRVRRAGARWTGRVTAHPETRRAGSTVN